MTYPEAIQYLESFINYERIPVWSYKGSLKLERFRAFLSTIGNPQSALRCIHVAGSKGKGSTCAFLTYILRQAGYAVGLYTSPHLSDFRERIRILSPRPPAAVRAKTKDDFEGMISKRALTYVVRKLKPAIEAFSRTGGHGPLSFFEVYTAAAFVYFKKENVDFVVLETGLGGRLDATNAADALIPVITPISYEHTQKLGTTLSKIAGEKAGIIKGRQAYVMGKKAASFIRRSSIVISAPQEKEAGSVIRNRCRQVGRHLWEVGNQIRYARSAHKGIFSIRGIYGRYARLKTKLPGAHQIVNAAVAVGAIEALRNYGIVVRSQDIRKGIVQTTWPGRCEVVSRTPLIVLDGAQNGASCRALRVAIKENFRYRELVLVVGISNDKDIPGICRELRDLADAVIITRARNPRASAPLALREHFNGLTTRITGSVQEALRCAAGRAKKKDLILITGSLFVVGEARAALKNMRSLALKERGRPR